MAKGQAGRGAVVVALLLTAGVAAADPVEIALKNQVPLGQKPSLAVKALEALRGVRLQLQREDDGKSFAAEHGALKAGQAATLTIGDGRAGKARWKGQLILLLRDGNRSTSEVSFETAVTGELKVSYRRDHLDLEARTLEFQLSRPAGRAELRVFGEDGGELGRGEAVYRKESPGTWLKIAWTQRAGNVLRLELRAIDADGVATLVKLMPWSVHIPHEEVVFETKQAIIRPAEEAKLHASYQRIIEAVEKARRAEPSIAVRVFIAGHTDTVGKPEDNRKLSLARARAIAAFFRDHGLPLPISYAGFGEDVLKVKTPDNTDEERNRRADYIVGVEEPVVGRSARVSWTPLR